MTLQRWHLGKQCGIWCAYADPQGEYVAEADALAHCAAEVEAALKSVGDRYDEECLLSQNLLGKLAAKDATIEALQKAIGNSEFGVNEILQEKDAEITRLNQMLRDTGYGQGQIDAYAAQCEEIARLTETAVDRLNKLEHAKYKWQAAENKVKSQAAEIAGLRAFLQASMDDDWYEKAQKLLKP